MAFLDFLNDPRRRLLAEQGLAGNVSPDGLTPGINPNAPQSSANPTPDTAPRAPISPPWTPGAVTAMGGDVLVPEKPAGLPGDMGGTPPPSVGLGRPSSLPDAPTYRPTPTARPELDMAGASTAMVKPQTRYQELEEARNVFAQKPRSRLMSGLVGALQGFGQGGLGGAIAGGAAGAINPRGMRRLEFDQQVKPKILERFGYEDQDIARRTAAGKMQREDELAQAQTANIKSQIEDRTAERNLPLVVPYGSVAIGKSDGKPIFTNARQEGQQQTPHWESTTEGIQNLNAPENKGKVFQPFEKPTGLPDQAARATTELQELKRRAARDWAAWGNSPEGPDKETAKLKASASQGAYNDGVRQLGENYPEFFETGGFTEANGNQGWGYFKRRQGQGSQSQGAAPRSGSAKPMKGQPGRMTRTLQEAADLLK